MEGLQLKHFHGLCVACSKLAPKAFKDCPEDQLQKTLTLLEKEAYTMPTEFKENLFHRYFNMLHTERRYQTLLEFIEPWQEKPWSNLAPMLGGLFDVPAKRMTQYKKCLFTKVLGNLIMKGGEQSKVVLHICQMCIQMAARVDTVMLDDIGAVTYDEGQCIWQALVCIITDTLDPALVVTVGKQLFSLLLLGGHEVLENEEQYAAPKSDIAFFVVLSFGVVGLTKKWTKSITKG
eukprot:6471461-Amphidinium_carterae.5